MWIELPWPENLANIQKWHTKHWTAVLTLFGLISNLYHNLPHWRSNQWPQNAEPKLNHWATNPHYTPNQLVMVIAWPINLNVSCKLHPYSLQRTQSPSGLRLPKRNGNTHPHNCYNLKSKEIDENFLFIFKEEELYCELNKHDRKSWVFVTSPSVTTVSTLLTRKQWV